MRVLVDGTPLLGEASIGNYLRQLLVNLIAEGPGHDYELFFRAFRTKTLKKVSETLKDSFLADLPARTSRIPNRVLEWCWTTHSFRLPLTERWLGKPDVFLSTLYVTPVIDRPVVMIAYDLIPLRFPQFYGQDQPLLQARLSRGVERASAIIAISEATKRDFEERLGADPARTRVVHPGVGARFGPEIDRQARDEVLARYRLRQPYLLYVGVFAPHKNVSTLLRIFRRLKQTGRIPHQLVLCGSTAWGERVREEARDLTSAGDCAILGYVPDADLPHLYRGADALALLSLYEGFGLPALEAMASGVPVMVSNVGSLPEVVGDAGISVPPTDDQAIENALGRLLSDAALREELRALGLRQAAKFCWAKSAREFLEVFETARRGR